jgi:hypothetical protein
MTQRNLVLGTDLSWALLPGLSDPETLGSCLDAWELCWGW